MKTLSRQTLVRDGHRALGLSGKSVRSPYFQMTDLRKKAPGRDIQFISSLMSRTGFIQGYQNDGIGLDVLVTSWDDTSPYTAHGTDAIYFATNGANTQSAILALAVAAANAFAASNGFTYSTLFGSFDTSADVAAALANYSPTRTINTPTRALNTAYQPSTTQSTLVIMSVEQDANLTLSGGAKGNVQMLISPTSSFATSTLEDEAVNGSTGTVVVGIATTSAGGAPLIGYVPAGYYYKVVSANTTGMETFTVLQTTEVVGI